MSGQSDDKQTRPVDPPADEIVTFGLSNCSWNQANYDGEYEYFHNSSLLLVSISTCGDQVERIAVRQTGEHRIVLRCCSEGHPSA